MALRQFRPLRPRIVGNQEVDTNVYTADDVTADYAHTIALEQLVPRMAQEGRRAISVNPKYYYYFMRKTIGRRCSCVSSSQTPEGQCPICWYTGIVGGYDKYGTVTEVLDVTYPNTVMVGVAPNFDESTRPTMFQLLPDVLVGYIETKIELRNNIHTVDYLANVYRAPANTTVTAFVRAPGEVNYVLLNTTNLVARLNQNALYLKIVFTRKDSSTELPVFSHLALRYKLLGDVRIIGDPPRRTESVALAEFGVYENFSTQAIFFDNTIDNFNNYNWFYRTDDKTRWKIIEVQANKPLGINTSTMLTARLVQAFDSYAVFPQGSD